MKLKLVQTCGACPEAYDVFTPDGDKIGYLRLRHGFFYAEYTPTQDFVYSANPKGDGIFDSEERDYYLGEACEALIKEHERIEQKPGVKQTFYFGS